MSKNISSIIFPNNKIKLYLITIFIIGLISGSIFLTVLDNDDKALIIKEIQTFISNPSKIDLKNTLILNYTYIISIFIIGISTLGIIINNIIVYLKGFLIGFSISSFIYSYKLKGLIAAIIYIIPHQLINIILIISLAIYSTIFSYYLIKLIKGHKINMNLFFKKYIFIFIIYIIIITITSVLEFYLMPQLFKITSTLYK